MSFFDAYVGIGGTFSTVAAAINSGARNICVLSNTTETSPWIFNGGESQVTLFPTASILYNGTDPLIQCNAIDNYFITINNGLLVTSTEYVVSTPDLPNSQVKFNYVTLSLTAFRSRFSASNLYLYNCNITCLSVYLISRNNSNADLSNSIVYGNIFLSNQNYTDISVKLDTNTIQGSISVYPNAMELARIDIKAAVGFPSFYTITNNRIEVMSFVSLEDTSAFFAGLTVVNNHIVLLNTIGDKSITIAFATFTNNTIEETNMANTEYNSWTNLSVSTFSNNTLLGAMRLGDVLFSTITDNLFDELAIGSTNPDIGSINLSKITNNIIANLIINEGISVGTEISDNIIGNTLTVNGSMGNCVLIRNRVSGDIVFTRTMKNNNLTGNAATHIIYNDNVDSEIITEHLNVKLRFKGLVNNLSFHDNTNCKVRLYKMVSSSRFLSNYRVKIKALGVVCASIFSFNSGRITSKGKVYSCQIAYNNNIKLKLHKVKRSIVNYNITKYH